MHFDAQFSAKLLRICELGQADCLAECLARQAVWRHPVLCDVDYNGVITGRGLAFRLHACCPDERVVTGRHNRYGGPQLGKDFSCIIVRPDYPSRQARQLVETRDWLSIPDAAMLASQRIAAAPTLEFLLTRDQPRDTLPEVAALAQPSALLGVADMATTPVNDLQLSMSDA